DPPRQRDRVRPRRLRLHARPRPRDPRRRAAGDRHGRPQPGPRLQRRRAVRRGQAVRLRPRGRRRGDRGVPVDQVRGDQSRVVRRTSLADYRRKRRFEQTPEPSGDRAAPGEGAQPSGRFVVHEHHARRLHWDLRLERDGVLASWAIPNGIPDDPRRNRKAVHVEDHPLEYLDFHGTIPRGEYGAGEISIWDRGTYTTEKWLPERVIVVFDGERLTGRYALFQAGRTDKDWMIHRMDPPVDATARELPDPVAPMLARLSTMPPDESRWGFEVKWD